MIDTPYIAHSSAQLAAVIHLNIPRATIKRRALLLARATACAQDNRPINGIVNRRQQILALQRQNQNDVSFSRNST